MICAASGEYDAGTHLAGNMDRPFRWWSAGCPHHAYVDGHIQRNQRRYAPTPFPTVAISTPLGPAAWAGASAGAAETICEVAEVPGGN